MRATILLTLLILTLPFLFALPCTSTLSITVQNTHPNGYLYLRADTPSTMNVSITPMRSFARHGETKHFTLTLTSPTALEGVLTVRVYNSGVLMKTLTLPYTLTCPERKRMTGGNETVQAERTSMLLIHDLFLLGFTLIFILLTMSLAAWWKKRWIRAEKLRILHISRRKPISPAWLIILTLLILTGIIILALILILTTPWNSLTSIF